MRKAAIKIEDKLAGWLTQDEHGYSFVYDSDYASQPNARPVSLTLPVKETSFISKTLFPFFDGLIPEMVAGYSRKKTGNSIRETGWACYWPAAKIVSVP
ncbi:MAG: hypothetical protein UZ06_CHB003000301 [Chlorobi bacterium OLB6]|nr:MAG: hypothetical protein UZ06_CHB003000301 [Chlorobi bacterium OLB6]